MGGSTTASAASALPPDVVSLAALATGWLAGQAVNKLLKRAGWSKARRRVVPLVAAVVGAATQSAIEAAVGGGGWRAAVMGALAGGSAVAVHELTGPKPDPAEAEIKAETAAKP